MRAVVLEANVEESYSQVPLADATEESWDGAEVSQDLNGAVSLTIGKRATWCLAATALLLAACLGVMVGARNRSEPFEQTQRPEQRSPQVLDHTLLQSRKLAELVTAHTIAFHREAGLPFDELGKERRQHLGRQLEDAAMAMAQDFVSNVSLHDPEAGRALGELRLGAAQWEQVESLMDMLHNPRVQELGHALHGAHDIEAALPAREAELRNLASQLLPRSVRNTPSLPGDTHWQMLASSKGLKSTGHLGAWQAKLTLTAPVPAEYEALPQKSGRRLQGGPGMTPGTSAAVVGGDVYTGVPAWYATTLRGMFLVVGTVLSTVLTLITTILTAILGPVGARVWWWIQTSLAISDCAGQLTLTLTTPQFREWYQWLPCIIMSFFTGWEAVWTFRK